jgi:hypothetical protein
LESPEKNPAGKSMNRLNLLPATQKFPDVSLPNPIEELRRQLLSITNPPQPGKRVAIAVGSRGIEHIADFVSEIVNWVKTHDAIPFIVPAMGSHGGATAEGQTAVLRGYGISEETTGAPIISFMDPIELPSGDAGVPVYCDANAYGADHIIIINRVKPHTSFHGKYESGLMKMLAIGLGKQKQAEAIHKLGVTGLRDIMPKAAMQVLKHANIYLGIAIVENAYDNTHTIAVIPANEIPEREPELLILAKSLMPKLPVDDIDLLIVDEMGKNISGLGMDPNIIGRLKISGQQEPDNPRIKCIIVRDLTAQSHGNAAGMGLADIITRQFADKIDFKATYANILTTGFLERGKMPIVADNDDEAVEIAINALNIPPEKLRVLHIKNTLHIDSFNASEAIIDELIKHSLPPSLR